MHDPALPPPAPRAASNGRIPVRPRRNLTWDPVKTPFGPRRPFTHALATDGGPMCGVKVGMNARSEKAIMGRDEPDCPSCHRLLHEAAGR